MYIYSIFLHFVNLHKMSSHVSLYIKRIKIMNILNCTRLYSLPRYTWSFFSTNNYHYKVLGFQLLKKMTFCGCGHKITTNTRLHGWALRLQQAIINKLKYSFNHMYTKHELWTFTIIQLTQTCTQTNYIHNNKKWNKVNKNIGHIIVH